LDITTYKTDDQRIQPTLNWLMIWPSTVLELILTSTELSLFVKVALRERRLPDTGFSRSAQPDKQRRAAKSQPSKCAAAEVAESSVVLLQLNSAGPSGKRLTPQKSAPEIRTVAS
jgi:hypothetical protein